MKAFRALYLANAREFTRDKLALAISIFMPLLFAVFFGLLFSSEQSVRVRLGLALPEGDAAGRQIVALLRGEALADVIEVTEGELEPLLQDLREGRQHIVLALPEGLSAALSRGQQLPARVYYDPARQTSAGTGLGLMRNFLGQANLALAGAPELLVFEPQTIEARRTNMAGFYIPSMLGLAILWLGVFGTAQPLVEMREQKVLRRLGVAPLSRRTVLAGQVAWRVTVGVVQALLFLALAVVVFNLGLGPQFWLFPVVVLLGAVSFVTMGYFIAAISASSESAVAIAQVVNFAMTFFSGSFFEPDFLPAFLRPVLYLMPLTYLSDALRQVMTGHRPLMPLWLDIAVLAVFLVLMVPLTIRFWRWE